MDAVRKLLEELEERAFDADHMAITPSCKEKSIEMSKMYARGCRLCDKVLDNKICMSCFRRKLRLLGLEQALDVGDEEEDEEAEEGHSCCLCQPKNADEYLACVRQLKQDVEHLDWYNKLTKRI